MGFGDLPIGVLQHIGAVAVQHTRHAALQRGRVTTCFHAFTGGFNADQTGFLKRDVGVKNAHGVGATTHTGQHRVGLQAVVHMGHLGDAFFANHALEIAHHHRVGVWACHGANDVKSVIHIGHPVTQGFVQGVFQGFAAGFHRHHGGTQELHAVNIGALAFHILAAHVDHAFQAITGTNGGGGNTVLTRAGFGNDARLAHALGQHGLADGVVDLVGTGVVQVFALQVNLRTTHFTAHAGSMVNGRGATDKMRQFRFELGDEGGVVLVLGVGIFQLFDGVGQRFADKTAAVNAKVAAGVGLLVGSRHGFSERGAAHGLH